MCIIYTEKEIKMKLFVSKSDRIEIEIYAFNIEKGGEKCIDAAMEKKDIPKEKEFETLKFIFQRPSYADNRAILSASQVVTSDGNINGNPFELQGHILSKLLVGWDLKDEDGKEIEFTPKNLGALDPTLARTAVGKILTKINF